MNIKDCTRTKGGHEVVIWEVIDGIAFGRFNWKDTVQIAKWFAQNGHCFWLSIDQTLRTEFDLDLTDWRDQIPWDRLIDEIEWVARDKMAGWYGYKTKPEAIHSVWVSNQTCSRLEAVKGMPPGPANWREAIARRPEK